MTKVKICGITRAEDAVFCDEMGADFLGFIFVRESTRYIEPEKAAEIVSRSAVAKPPLLDSGAKSGGRAAALRDPYFVGVFRDATLQEIERVAKIVRLDFVQLHGSESDELVEKIALPVIKAFRVTDALPDVETKAEWVMFDSGGGTGRVFDWSLVSHYRERPFFLAGGITPENVADAIRTVQPYAIDVASGVESEPGVKSHAKVRELFRKVRP